MTRVQVLPKEIIARIAAGEVVDRPASVLKELLENSLDAGSQRIEVVLKEGGKSLIHVRDDGSGIAPQDMERMFQRHATSKISTAGDLDHILSYGFRGEALYSISSVAEVTLTSRLKGAAPDAWQVSVKGGKRGKGVPAAMPSQGTDIRVEDLFFNTPARKKFLKSDPAEFTQALGVFVNAALQSPERHFILTHNGKNVYDLKPAADLASRAAACLNQERAHLIEHAEEIPGSNIRLRLVLGDINIQRPRKDLQYVYVNGRPVQHKGIAYNVNDVFRMVMPPEANPFFIVFLDIPAEDVDVNIHPQKREVRLRDESRVTGILRGVVERALMTKGTARQAGLPDVVDSGLFSDAGLLAGSDLSGGVSAPRSFNEGIAADKIIFTARQGGAGRGSASAQQPFDRELFRAQAESFRAGALPQVSGVQAPRIGPAQGAAPLSLKDRLSEARYMGTFLCKYHLFEEAQSLFVVDQHAAQERIMYERICGQLDAGRLEVQRLLLPLALRLTQAEMTVWEGLKEQLAGLGFESQMMGLEAVSLMAHPVFVQAPERVFRELLADEGILKTDRDTLARRACRLSVMSGERMHEEAARYQLKELMTCREPMTCPHGRPVFIEVKASFLDRQFFRS